MRHLAEQSALAITAGPVCVARAYTEGGLQHTLSGFSQVCSGTRL